MKKTQKPGVTDIASNVVQLRENQSKTEPPEGWQANSEYGLLRRDTSDAGKLVRILDIAVWLASTLPRKTVVYEIGSKLVTYSGQDTEFLYILNSQTYAQPFVICWEVNRDESGYWQFFPELDHSSKRDDVARGVAEAFDRVWPGLSNPALDNEWRIQRAIAKNKERGAMEKADRDGVDYNGLSWPEDDFMLTLLHRLAVPVATAFELWGYGCMPVTNAMNSELPKDKNAEFLALLDAYEKRGAMTRERFAKTKGLTEANLKKRLGQARTLKKEKASNPFSGLTAGAGKK